MECPLQKGDFEKVKDLCRYNSYCYCGHCRYNMPLITLILHRHYHIALFLLDNEGDPNESDDEEKTPLFYLCSTMDDPPIPEQLDLFNRMLPLITTETITVLYTIAIQKQNCWLRNECRTRSLTYYSIQTLFAAIEICDQDMVAECMEHVSLYETGTSRFGLVTPFELVCHMVSEQQDKLTVSLWHQFLPFYRDQLTYHKVTCVQLLRNTPFVYVMCKKINPLLFLYKNKDNDKDLFQDILSWKDIELMQVILPLLPRHVRFHYLISRDPWINQVPILSPLLDVFFKKECTMEKYDWEEGYKKRFEPFL